MAGWDTLHNLILYELVQREEEGCDVTAMRKKYECELIGAPEVELDVFYDRLMALEIEPQFPYDEPSDLENIRKRREDGPRRMSINRCEDWLFDRIYGAWLGRSAGCALGKPFELQPYMGGRKGRIGFEFIREYLEGADAWPLTNYVPGKSRAEGLTLRNPLSQRENIAFMETDDDIRYTVLGLKILEEKGKHFSTADVGMTWLEVLPYIFVCTAERQAYLNLANRFMGKETLFSEKDLEYAQLYRNPYREWIGAQIRVDSYAYVMPGNPELAAELAYRDARLSHVKNGIYGAMFVAAMISAGFMTANPEDVIAIGLSEIPKTSRLYADVQRGVEIAQQAANLDDLMNDLWGNLGHYHPVHTNNNAALIAAALIYGGDDFERCITTAVVGGWDTDCNGATVGSIWGAMHGARALPEEWTEPLHDTLYSCIPDFHPIRISECAKRSTRLALDFLEHD